MALNNSNSINHWIHLNDCLIFDWQYHAVRPDAAAIMVASLACFTSFLAITVNGLVIVTIYRTETLHSPSNVLVAVLALSELGNGLITQPSQVIQLVASMHGDICTSGAAFLVLNISGWVFTILSLWTLTFIAADRYCAVEFHLRYNGIVTNKRLLVLLSTTWVAVPLSSLLVFVKTVDAEKFLLVHSSVILIGIVITCLCYLKVFIVVRRHFKQIASQLPLQALDQKSIIKARYKRKFCTVLYIVGAFVVCYLPYSVAVLTGLRKIGRMMLLASCVGGNACINPVLFFWRIRELRVAAMRNIKTLLRCKKH